MTGVADTEAVAIVRRALAAFNRGEIEATLSDSDEHVEIDWSESRGPMAGIYHGHDGFRRLIEHFDVFEQVAIEPLELVTSGEYVIVPVQLRFTGRDGIALEARSALVFTFRDRKITSLRLFQDEASARAAVAGA